MSGNARYEPQTGLGRLIDAVEVNGIALILALMTVITFVNVVLRYVFNTGLIWGLEVVLILFAWLVILGTSHAIKITANLGVDAVMNLLPRRGQRVLALISAVLCLIYAALLMKGAWDYWAPFAGLDQTTGRWFPTGFDPKTRDRAFYITEQVPMPDFLRFLEGWINEGEHYDKLPRVIPYAVLPFGVALILYRLVEATLGLLRGERASLIVSHEAEDAIDELNRRRDDDRTEA